MSEVNRRSGFDLVPSAFVALLVAALLPASCGKGTTAVKAGHDVSGTVSLLEVAYGSTDGDDTGTPETCVGTACDPDNGTAAPENGVAGCVGPVDWECQDDQFMVRCVDGALQSHGCGDGQHCTNGACLSNCAAGTANCSGDPADGCNIDTTSDPKHCGNCVNSCGDGQCVDSTCVCASTSQTATSTPLDMYIMMDQSGSMGEDTGTGAIKWDAVSQALGGFLNDAASAGIGVGLQFFPIVGPPDFFGDTTDSCTVGDYAKPEVGIKVLPGNAGALIAAMKKHGPNGSTPTYPALKGAVTFAKTFATQNPTHTVVVVLATDGVPTECDPQDIPTIAAIAKTAANGTPKVLTFVIGVGSELGSLNSIAASGGTKTAFLVDQGGNVVTAFEAALKAIEGQALGCTYAIPMPTNSQPMDYTKVNVKVGLGGLAGSVLNYFDTAAGCDATAGGWYYDDAAAPNKILLCPATCTAVMADPNAKVDILLGCGRTAKPTQTQP